MMSELDVANHQYSLAARIRALQSDSLNKILDLSPTHCVTFDKLFELCFGFLNIKMEMLILPLRIDMMIKRHVRYTKLFSDAGGNGGGSNGGNERRIYSQSVDTHTMDIQVRYNYCQSILHTYRYC